VPDAFEHESEHFISLKSEESFDWIDEYYLQVVHWFKDGVYLEPVRNRLSYEKLLYSNICVNTTVIRLQYNLYFIDWASILRFKHVIYICYRQERDKHGHEHSGGLCVNVVTNVKNCFFRKVLHIDHILLNYGVFKWV